MTRGQHARNRSGLTIRAPCAAFTAHLPPSRDLAALRAGGRREHLVGPLRRQRAAGLRSWRAPVRHHVRHQLPRPQARRLHDRRTRRDDAHARRRADAARGRGVLHVGVREVPRDFQKDADRLHHGRRPRDGQGGAQDLHLPAPAVHLPLWPHLRHQRRAGARRRPVGPLQGCALAGVGHDPRDQRAHTRGLGPGVERDDGGLRLGAADRLQREEHHDGARLAAEDQRAQTPAGVPVHVGRIWCRPEHHRGPLLSPSTSPPYTTPYRLCAD